LPKAAIGGRHRDRQGFAANGAARINWLAFAVPRQLAWRKAGVRAAILQARFIRLRWRHPNDR
jgi:hypothetical protein